MIKNKIQEFKELAIKHGPYFLAYAVIIELIEDVVAPAFLVWIGKAYLAPLALAIHIEPVAYPLYFFVAKAVKR